MAFVLETRVDKADAEWIAEFSFPAEVKRIKTHASEILFRELWHYVEEGTSGRSFLVSGHRGAGKTTMVRSVVDDLNRDLLRAAQARVAEAGRASKRQRPILVRLHGPSLFPPAAARNATDPTPPVGVADGSSTGTEPAAHVVVDPVAVAAAATPETDDIAYALTEITVSLFRTLAAEHARAFGFHAREVAAKAGPASDQNERAAQLQLDLDDGPDVALLRQSYQHLGRLQTGVLWPEIVGKHMVDGGLSDQGLREIVALSTASQAFEVCVSKIEAKKTRNAKAGVESTVEIKISGLKDIVNALLGVGTGIAAGIGTGSPFAGFLAGLAGLFALSMTSTRSQKVERTSDSSIVRDLSKQSLARDLPWVVQRIREAGLAPVFVIDELDKLGDPGLAIGRLIDRLKHLTTDYGVFLFLTDRSYYEEVVAKTERESFPKESSYFTHLLFVLPTPSEILRFLIDLIQSDQPVVQPVPTAGDTVIATVAIATAKMTLALFLLHRSKMNTTGLVRALAQLSRRDGSLKVDESDLASEPGYRLTATLQMTINYFLESPEFKRRADVDVRFMQAAVDAFYIVSRAWEGEQASVSLERSDIVRQLLLRQGQQVPEDDEQAEALLLGRNAAGAQDLSLLETKLHRFADLLTDFTAIRTEIASVHRNIDQYPLDIVPLVGPSLLSRIDGSRSYRFLVDIYGSNLESPDPPPAVDVAPNGGPPDPSGPASNPARTSTVSPGAIEEAVEFHKCFADMLGRLGVSIADLAALRVLPSAIGPGLTEAADRLATGIGSTRAKPLRDLRLTQALPVFLSEYGEQFSTLITLGVCLWKMSGTASIRPSLEGIARHCDLGATFGLTSPRLPNSTLLDTVGLPKAIPIVSLNGDLSTLKAWIDELFDTMDNFMFTPETPVISDVWANWASQTHAFLLDGFQLEPARFDNMVQAALGEVPGTLFRYDLSAMNALDWTRVCLTGFSDGDVANEAQWAFAAGLTVLGFSRGVVMQAIDLCSSPQDAAYTYDVWRGRLLDLCARQARNSSNPGVLFLISEDRLIEQRIDVDIDRGGATPYLVLNSNELTRYDKALSWLAQRKAIVGISYDEEQASLR